MSVGGKITHVPASVPFGFPLAAAVDVQSLELAGRGSRALRSTAGLLPRSRSRIRRPLHWLALAS